MAAPPPTSRLPRWLRIASWPIGGLLLVSFFVFLGFPYDLLAQRIGNQVERSTGMRVRIGELSPHIGLAGLGLAARDVLASPEGGRTISVQKLVVRPAWSLAWFRGVPAVHLDVTSEIGNGVGTITLGATGGWEGELEAVQLEYLPLEMLESFNIDGVLDADVDLHAQDPEAGGGLLGDVDFDLRDGSLATDGLPVAVPFERLHGQLRFGGEKYLIISGVELEGPMIAGTIEGEVGQGPSPDRQPVSVKIAYEVRDQSLAGMLSGMGSTGPGGSSEISVTGTVAQPVVR
jgi:type II secretion system protein N